MLAANGIDVNAAIGVANGASGKLHLVMTANGNAASTSNSKGLTLNSAIDANGGNIVLNGTSAFGNGVQIGSNVTSVGADITITGTSAATTTDGSNAGIYAAGGTVTGKNVTLIGSATDTAAGSRVLGYRGAGVSIQASDKLSITGSTQNLASGVYGFTGTYSAANGITIEGTSARGKGVGFDNNATLTNTSSGGISITGTSNDVTKNALGFQGVSITNASTDGSNTSLIARSGNVLTDSTSVGAWGGGVIQNTITNASGAGRIEVLAGNNSATSSSKIDGAALRIRQNSNAGVTLLTSGTGDLTVGSLENMGTGILVLAAGSQISPGGSGAGGNVKLASGSYTRANNGNLKVSTGSYDTAGAISAFNALTRTTAGFNTLYYNSPSAANNVGFNKGYSSTLINGDASNQMLFRQDKTPTFTLALTGTSAVYGRDAYPASQATELARLKSANGAVSSVTPLLSATEGSNTFTLATADVMNNLSVNRTLGARSAGGYESANIPGYAYNAGTAAVNGLQLNTTITGIAGAALVHSISKATASITASTASVVYNGATQNQATVSTGLKAGDAIQVNGTASGRNVGSYGSTLSVSGSDTANYTIALADGNMTITPAQLIVAARPNTKVVDGNTNSSNTPAITGLAAVDKLVGTPAQTYGDASIGTGKTLTPSRLAVSDGNNGNNYVVTYQPSTAGVITTIPNINPVIPAVPVNPRVKVAKGPVGSNFTLTGLEVQEACSITALEKCSCEEFTELSTRTPVSESAKDIAILICTPAAQGQAR